MEERRRRLFISIREGIGWDGGEREGAAESFVVLQWAVGGQIVITSGSLFRDGKDTDKNKKRRSVQPLVPASFPAVCIDTW